MFRSINFCFVFKYKLVLVVRGKFSDGEEFEEWNYIKESVWLSKRCAYQSEFKTA